MSFKTQVEARALRTVAGGARTARVFMMSSLVAALLAACGGGRTDTATAGMAGMASSSGRAVAQSVAGTTTTTTHADAFRLLTQATFGPTTTDLVNAMSLGAPGWVSQQLSLPDSAQYLNQWNADNAALAASGGATPMDVDFAFYRYAMTSPDQLRQRVAFALSEIFVVSMLDVQMASYKSQMAASYFDMLSRDAFGNFRTLLQDVAMHPAMGQYLSSLGNQKEEPAIGRIPDQNFAREVMQLFTIGLVQLNIDGTPKLDASGQPIYTYGPSDIDGLSRVFTGFSWYGPDTSTQRFFSNPSVLTLDRLYNPMQAYPTFHSTSEKDFLGAVVPAQSVPDPATSLKIALDTLYNHPNVGPFISKQLIQRLVTSNPSPAYVARVAGVFNNDGKGVRGNLAAVAQAILLDPEARDPSLAATPGYGKVREPILRLTAFLRAYNATSDSGGYLIGITDDPGTGLGESPLRSPGVFNYYRPQFVYAGGATAAHAMVAPEMQITNETTVAGYVNFMSNVIRYGVGAHGLTGTATRADVQPNLTAAQNLAGNSTALVADVCARLIGDTVDPALLPQIQTAVDSIIVPTLNKSGSNTGAINNALRSRALTAVLLALASPEYITQK